MAFTRQIQTIKYVSGADAAALTIALTAFLATVNALAYPTGFTGISLVADDNAPLTVCQFLYTKPSDTSIISTFPNPTLHGIALENTVLSTLETAVQAQLDLIGANASLSFLAMDSCFQTTGNLYQAVIIWAS